MGEGGPPGGVERRMGILDNIRVTWSGDAKKGVSIAALAALVGSLAAAWAFLGIPTPATDDEVDDALQQVMRRMDLTDCLNGVAFAELKIDNIKVNMRFANWDGARTNQELADLDPDDEGYYRDVMRLNSEVASIQQDIEKMKDDRRNHERAIASGCGHVLIGRSAPGSNNEGEVE